MFGLLLVAWILSSCLNTHDLSEPRSQRRFSISFDINKEVYRDSDWTEPPQFALWLENPSSGTVRTLFVTRRTARDDWLGKAACPASLPYWVTRYQQEFGKQRGPTYHDPLPDAMTGATPKRRFAKSFQVGEGPWDLYLEVNVSGDYNAHYEQVFTDMGPADFGNGQPSLVYRARDIGCADSRPEVIAQTRETRNIADMLIEPEYITTAYELIQNITIREECEDDNY